MATTTNDLLSAIDAYMLSKGKGMGYLASKVNEIFDDKDAPLNAKTGPLRIMSEMFDDLQIKIKALHIGATSPLSVFKKETTWLNKSLKSFNKKIGTVIDSLNLVDAFLKSIMTISKPSGTGPSGIPYKLTSDGMLKVSLWGMLPKYSLAGIPVYIKNISDHVVDKFLRNSTREKVLSSPIPIETVNKKPNQVNNTIFNTQNNENDSEKGGWLSSILGIGAGLLGIGWLNSELDKTEAGQQVKSQIKTFISTLFDRIGEWITTDGKDYMISAVKGLWGGLKWLGKDIYNKIIKGNYAAAIAESLFSWAVLRKLPVTGWIIRPMEKLLKFGFGKVFSNVGSTISNIGSKIWGPLSRFGGLLLRFAGKASIIGGILTGLYVIWDRSTEIFKIVKDINATSEAAQEKTLNIQKSFRTKNMTRNELLQKELDDLKAKELNGSITSTEKIIKKQLEIKQKINSNDNLLEVMAINQANRTEGMFGFMYSAETPSEKKAREELRGYNSKYYDELKSLTNEIGTLKTEVVKEAKEIVPTMDYWKNMDQRVNDVRKLNGLKDIKTVPVHDATVIQPHSKDQILMAKSGGPFDLAMKQMNNLMRDKLDMLIDVVTANVHATIEGSGAIVKTVAATSNKGGTSPGGFGSSHDPIRSMRNQVNNSIR